MSPEKKKQRRCDLLTTIALSLGLHLPTLAASAFDDAGCVHLRHLGVGGE